MPGNELRGGSLGDLEDTLALYLEEEFDAVRQAEYGLDPLPDEGREERMLLFLGIGRAVVRYLAEHAAAFVIDDHDSTTAWGHTGTKTGHVRIRAEGDLHP